MPAPGSKTIRDRKQAIEVANTYLDNRDDAEIAPYVSGMMTPKAEQAFAVMQGSGNEMGLFEQFVGLLKLNGLITRQESLNLVRLLSPASLMPLQA